MGKFSELDFERQTVEFFRTPTSLPPPFDQVRVIGKLVPAPDNSANRAAWQRRKALAQAERFERNATIDRVSAAGRAS